MSYEDLFAGSAGHFNPTGMDIHHHSTQPSAQYSLEGSPDLSDSSQNSLPLVHQDNRYAHTMPAPPASIPSLPMGNYAGPYPFDNPAIAQTSRHWATSIGSLNEQEIPDPQFYMQIPAHGAYAQHAPHYVGPALEPLLQAHRQTPRDEPGFGGNSIIRSYYLQNGQGLGTDTGGETSFTPQVSSYAQQSHSTENNSNPNTWLGGSQNEAMGSVATTYPSTIASPQSPLDADDEVASPQSVETEASQTGNASGQQSPNIDLPLDRILPWLQATPLPQAPTGAGSRGGTESWTCTYHGCEHRPFARQDQAKDHVASHLGLKPFLCEHCQKGFTRRADCKRHMEKACKSPQATTTTGIRPLAPTPGGSPGIISPTSAGSPLLFPSDGRAKKEDAKGLQMIGPHRTLPRTKAQSKSSPRLQVRDSSSKKGRKGSKSPSSTGGSPTTHPDDMWSQH